MTKLLELMSARMFHDLAGPIGAVDNSVDFIEDEDPVIREKAFNLIKSSANESIIRLKYFRQAYGNLNDNEVHANNIFDLVKEFIGNNKIKLDWKISTEMINTRIAKIILNFVIISLNSMIHGGVLRIELNDNILVINFEGENLILSDDMLILLKGETNHINLSSINIQIYYTGLILKDAKAKMRVNKTDRDIKFMVTC
ncbi:MAG: histidine phosphotransferase family protein [Pseudomonadota bacterium]